MILKRASLAIAMLLVAAAGPLPEPDDGAIETALARTIVGALLGSSGNDSYSSWQAFGASLPSAYVHWHLAPPDASNAPLVRRTGWIEGRTESGRIAACGNTSVRVLTFHFDLDKAELTPSLLNALGEESAEVSEMGDAWRVSSGVNARGSLQIEGQCTPTLPGLAKRCETNIRLVLRENDREALALDCPTP